MSGAVGGLVRRAASGRTSTGVRWDATLSVSALNGAEGRIGAAQLNWRELGFQYVATNGCARAEFQDGEWSEVRFVPEHSVSIHPAATALQYGQSCFEGLKAFASADGGVRLFRPELNARRMMRSAERIMMPALGPDEFVSACKKATEGNLEFVPPFTSGGALYLRPLLMGVTPRISVAPATQFSFVVIASPVADYYRGAATPVTAKIIEDFDRAAPRGLGHVKVGANYAADMLPSQTTKGQGFDVGLYLDAETRKHIEEFGTSNFVAIKGNTLVTPLSGTILASITNQSVQELARLEGLRVEKRPVRVEELAEFDEVAAVGTAVVLTPVGKIVHGTRTYTFGSDPQQPGPVFSRLHDRIRRIQTGQDEDVLSWMVDALR